MEPGARVWTEWRDASAPYRIGPSLRFDAEGRVVARDKTLLTIPIGQWVHFEIVCGMGTQGDRNVRPDGESPRPDAPTV